MKDSSVTTSINSFIFLVCLTHINFTILLFLHDVKLLVVDWVDVDSYLHTFISTGKGVKQVLAFRVTNLYFILFEYLKEALEINLILIVF